MLRALPVLLIIMGSFYPSYAEIAVIGAGGISCAQLGEMYKRNFASTEKYTFVYVQGYLSGLNDAQAMAGRNTEMRNLDILRSENTTMNAVRLACDQRPLAPVFGIVGDYWMTLPRVQVGH